MQKDMNIFPLTYAILHGIRVTRAARPEKSPIKRHFMHASAFERNIGKRYFVYLYCIVRYTGSPAVCPFRPRSCMQPAADDACAVYERRGAGVPRRARLRGGARPPPRSGGVAAGPVRPPPPAPGKKNRPPPGDPGGRLNPTGGRGGPRGAPRAGGRPPPAAFRRLCRRNRAPRPPLSGKKEPPHPGIHARGTAAPCAEAGSAYSFG